MRPKSLSAKKACRAGGKGHPPVHPAGLLQVIVFWQHGMALPFVRDTAVAFDAI